MKFHVDAFWNSAEFILARHWHMFNFIEMGNFKNF